MLRFTVVSAVAALGMAGSVVAQEYPTRPIRVVIPQSPGGAQDSVARIMTYTLSDRVGWRIVVDNRAGGYGFIGTSIAAKGQPDGYTLLIAHTGEFAVNPAIFNNVPYDLERDFTPVTMISDGPMLVIANPKVPVTNIKALLEMAKSKPGQVTYSSAGTGTINHLAGEWLAHAAGVKLLHVPYKGGAAAAAAVTGGEVVVGIASVAGAIPFVQGKRLRVLSLTTSKRMTAYPDWPTAQEAGIPNLDASIWVGMFAPKGVPRPIVNKLNAEVRKTLESPDVRARFTELGTEPTGMTPEAFRSRIQKDLERYRVVVKASGITPE
jgi:tripartite-type tricarboxylate transporter receptor subunit TctC